MITGQLEKVREWYRILEKEGTYLILAEDGRKLVSEQNKVAKMVSVPNGQVDQRHTMARRFVAQPAQTAENVTKRLRWLSGLLLGIRGQMEMSTHFWVQYSSSMQLTFWQMYWCRRWRSRWRIGSRSRAPSRWCEDRERRPTFPVCAHQGRCNPIRRGWRHPPANLFCTIVLWSSFINC